MPPTVAATMSMISLVDIAIGCLYEYANRQPPTVRVHLAPLADLRRGYVHKTKAQQCRRRPVGVRPERVSAQCPENVLCLCPLGRPVCVRLPRGVLDNNSSRIYNDHKTENNNNLTHTAT